MTGAVGVSAGSEATEADKQKMLEGYRRAHQWLRLNDLGDETGIAELRANFDDAVDYLWIQASLASLIRELLAHLGADTPRDLREANDAMLLLSRTLPPEVQARPPFAIGTLHIADGLARQRWPRQEDRLRFYEGAARNGYEIAEPGHPGRKGVLDE